MGFLGWFSVLGRKRDKHNINYLDNMDMYFNMTIKIKEEIKKLSLWFCYITRMIYILIKEGLSVVKEQMTGDIKYK